MATTLTYNDGINPPTTMIISPDALIAVQNFLPSVLAPGTNTQQYLDVSSWIKGVMKQFIFGPAMNAKPTTLTAAAIATQAAALAAMQAAINADVLGSIV
jgi:hypothetical protein